MKCKVKTIHFKTEAEADKMWNDNVIPTADRPKPNHAEVAEAVEKLEKTLARIKIFVQCEDFDAAHRAVTKMRGEFDTLDIRVNEARMRENK